MSKLAEIAARSAKHAATFAWTGRHATDFIPATTVRTGDTTIETAVQADEPNTFRDEVLAAPHLMSVKGGLVHYGYPESYGLDMPVCRQNRGNIRATFYRPVDLPVTCTNCISRYGSEN